MQDKEELWTLEALIDELVYALGSGTVELTEAGRTFHARKYYAQARKLTPIIPFANPVPDFVVNLSDLPDKTRTFLANIGDLYDQKYVLKQAVGQIFENLDFERYHRSLARKLNVVLRP